jgi:hypothetical protein
MRATSPQESSSSCTAKRPPGPHGIEFFDDWIAEPEAAYNLRVIGE